MAKFKTGRAEKPIHDFMREVPYLLAVGGGAGYLIVSGSPVGAGVAAVVVFLLAHYVAWFFRGTTAHPHS